jgi:hypothetical protein
VLALLSFSFGWIRIHGGVVQIFAKRRQRPVVIEKIVVVVELVTVISFALFAVVVFKLAARIVPIASVVFLFLFIFCLLLRMSFSCWRCCRFRLVGFAYMAAWFKSLPNEGKGPLL